MGLAASQARFLAITARKMNCEFQSMQIAQEKLSVTRDLQKASQDYQDSLDQTILVWDTEGTGETYNLSYNTLMVPSAINDFTPNLITDKTGRIVLTEDVYKAAVAAGIIDKDTGNPIFSSSKYTEEGRNKFLNKLGDAGLIDASLISSIKDLGSDGYIKDAGVGGELLNKTIADALPTSKFINYLKSTLDEDNSPLYKISLKAALGEDLKYVSSSTLQEDKQYTILKDGSALSERDFNNLTLGDLLSEKYELCGKNIGDMTSIICPKLIEQMANKLGANASVNDIVGLNVDMQAADALKKAIDFTNLQYLKDKSIYKSTQSAYDLIVAARDTSGFVTGNNDMSSVSLTNMLKAYLTNFVIAIEGYDCGYFVKDTPKESTYVTNDSSYYFLLQAEGARVTDAELNADFYNLLYNQLCMNGACSDPTKRELVTDNKYLNNAIKNGQLFISSLNEDGYFYQEPYVLNNHVAEVPDQDAIARAELDYNITKSKLNYREQSLDIQMKNLDTEISALTTEFDTVKNLISKNVEKIFTMFSS